MTRRKTTHKRRRQQIRLGQVERALYILGATFYLVGAFGGVGLLPMPLTTAVLLLGVGGGLQLVVTLMLLF